MNWYIECYKKNKIVQRINLQTSREDLLKMLRRNVIFYDSGFQQPPSYIHYLNNYDYIRINGNFFDSLIYEEQDTKNEEMDNLNKEINELQRIIDNAKEYIELLEDAFIKGEIVNYLLLDIGRQILEGDEIPNITRKYLKEKIKSE